MSRSKSNLSTNRFNSPVVTRFDAELNASRIIPNSRTTPAPVFAELRTPAGTIAIGAPATVGMLGDAAPTPGRNHSVIVELRVDDVDAARKRLARLAPGSMPEIVLEPTDMPWGNRSMILRDPDGGLVNLFAPVTPDARARYGL